jgi:hypothetical protein
MWRDYRYDPGRRVVREVPRVKNNIRSGKNWKLRALVLLILLAAVGVTACSGSPLTFSPAKLPEAGVGQPYQVTITVTDNKTPILSIEADKALPSGLSITWEKGQNTALISGTPQAAGAFKFTINAGCYATNKPGQSGHIEYELAVK